MSNAPQDQTDKPTPEDDETVVDAEVVAHSEDEGDENPWCIGCSNSN